MTARAELAKAFSVFDTDGNGVITVDEVAQLLQSIRPAADLRPVTLDEAQRLMAVMDKNHDGNVDLNEFLATMEDWLHDDKASSPLRTAAHDDALASDASRAHLHRNVKRFFLQLRMSGRDLLVVRDSMMDWQRSDFAYTHEDDMALDNSALNPVMPYGTAVAAHDRERALVTLASTNWDALVAAVVGAGTPQLALQMVSTLAEGLQVLLVINTAAERRLVSEELIKLFSACLNAVPALMRLLLEPYPELQHMCLQCLTLIVPGPRIGSTPEGHWLHTSEAAFKKAMLAADANAYGNIATFLGSPYIQVRRQALLCIGSLAQDDAEFRQNLLLLDVANPVINHLRHVLTMPPPDREPLLREATWVVSVLCRDVTQLPRTFVQLRHFILPIGQLLLMFTTTYADVETLLNVLKIIAMLLPGVVEDGNQLTLSLVQLLDYQNARVQTRALWCIGRLMADDNLTKSFLAAGLVPRLRVFLLHKDASLRMAACRTIAILCGAKGEMMAVADAGALDELFRLLKEDPQSSAHVVKVIKYLCRGPVRLVQKLVVQYRLVAALCWTFTNFVKKDSILEAEYHYQGAVYDFDLLHDATKALHYVLDAGQALSERDDEDGQRFIIFFDGDCISIIEQLLVLLANAPVQQLNAWRFRHPDGITIEERLKMLLSKLKGDLDHAVKDLPALAAVHARVKALLERFYLTGDQFNYKRFRFWFGNEWRAVEFPRSVRLSSILDSLPQWFFKSAHESFTLNVEAPDGSLQRILDQQMLERVIERAERDEAKFVSITLSKVASSADQDAASAFASRTHFVHRESFDALPSPQRAFSGQHARDDDDDDGDGEGTHKRAQRLSSRGMSDVDMTALAKFDLNEPAASAVKSGLFKDVLKLAKLTTDHINMLLNDWRKVADDGNLDRTHFDEGMRKLGVTDKLMLQANFDAFDSDGDGKVSFAEFLVGLSTMARGNVQERVRVIFNSYDLDGNGSIDKGEMLSILQGSRAATGEPFSAEDIQREVDELFAATDLNNDGVISFEEFCKAVREERVRINLTDADAAEATATAA